MQKIEIAALVGLCVVIEVKRREAAFAFRCGGIQAVQRFDRSSSLISRFCFRYGFGFASTTTYPEMAVALSSAEFRFGVSKRGVGNVQCWEQRLPFTQQS